MRVVLGVLIGLGILVAGVWMIRALAFGGPSKADQPEDVGALDVFFVCTECGTAYKVERLGKLQVPRHCGEPMRVEQRPRDPTLN
jgi:hypothetical protein